MGENQAGGTDSVYKPEKYARGVVSKEEEPGIGQRAEKAQLPTLEIYGSNLGSQWLMYGGMSGGVPDPEAAKEVPAVTDKVRCDWFRILYHGFIVINGEYVFGYWGIEVRGMWLQKVKSDVAQHRQPVLSVGKHPNSDTIIASITITEAKVSKQARKGPKVSREDEDEEED